MTPPMVIGIHDDRSAAVRLLVDRPPGPARRDDPAERGFSYIEVLIATALIAVCLAPAIDALQGGIQGAAIHAATTTDDYQLTGKMEAVLAQPFSSLEQAAIAAGGPTVATTYSDGAAAPSRRLVYLAPYDPATATFAAAPTGLLWVRVEIENTAHGLETLTTR